MIFSHQIGAENAESDSVYQVWNQAVENLGLTRYMLLKLDMPMLPC